MIVDTTKVYVFETAKRSVIEYDLASKFVSNEVVDRFRSHSACQTLLGRGGPSIISGGSSRQIEWYLGSFLCGITLILFWMFNAIRIFPFS